VRENAEKLTDEEILARVAVLGDPKLVVISGGNPALHRLGPLTDRLHDEGYRVSVETQGSIWRDWLYKVDRLVVSPKPPSSNMATEAHEKQTASFMDAAKWMLGRVAVKIVVFTEDDYEWALRFHQRYNYYPFYMSVGTTQGLDDPSTIGIVLDRLRWLCERVAGDPRASNVTVGTQLHVLAWGTRRGV